MSADENPVYIYVLRDPRTNEVRYVGKTDNLRERYRQHCSPHHKGNNRRVNWLNSLRKCGLNPIIEAIEECNQTNWIQREQFYIELYRGWGYDLVNATDGGEGMSGHRPSEETRRKISEAHKGKIPTLETRRKISEAHKGRPSNRKGIPPTPETRRKMSEAKKGRPSNRKGIPPTPETRRKMSEAQKGRPSNRKGIPLIPETRRKMSEAQKGRTHTLETRRKLSEVNKGRPSTNKRQVIQYSLGREFMCYWESITAPAQAGITSSSNIWKACSYKQESAGGYIWRYADDPLPDTPIGTRQLSLFGDADEE